MASQKPADKPITTAGEFDVFCRTKQEEGDEKVRQCRDEFDKLKQEPRARQLVNDLYEKFAHTLSETNYPLEASFEHRLNLLSAIVPALPQMMQYAGRPGVRYEIKESPGAIFFKTEEGSTFVGFNLEYSMGKKDAQPSLRHRRRSVQPKTKAASSPLPELPREGPTTDTDAPSLITGIQIPPAILNSLEGNLIPWVSKKLEETQSEPPQEQPDPNEWQREEIINRNLEFNNPNDVLAKLNELAPDFLKRFSPEQQRRLTEALFDASRSWIGEKPATDDLYERAGDNVTSIINEIDDMTSQDIEQFTEYCRRYGLK